MALKSYCQPKEITRLAQVALELESPERQRCKLADKLPFLLS
jgi:hypothetical protein